ncbi:ABC transporter ATP-binding protein [Flexivirga meconopsidis]|uniref:ABC transporter ATP-binding protein n=1 Tax=Flexivirga meconopsidis TaxID=2977121 RepID=UPI00224010E2|nr:ABC transporter ATP-binding protein [Flexivirga meconopsidis]
MTTTATGVPGSGIDPQGAPAIALAGLRKSFGQVDAVKGLDLTVQPGEVVAFLGPNGAGKTTTIDMMLGLSKPDAGTARVFGMQPRDAVARGLVAAVMQTGGLLRDLTVRETVDLTASLFVQTRSVQECLQRAGIDDIADRKVHKCSGGQQQRLRFAMALVSDPALIVLDEPTTGMDVTGRRDFWSAIRQDAERGRTVLFATHYLEEADLYADRIVLMRHGQIVADGTGSQIKAMASGRTVRATLSGLSDRELAAIPGVESVEVRGESVLLHAKDSDSVARHLLTQTNARDIEITARGLEDAFVALTSDEH